MKKNYSEKFLKPTLPNISQAKKSSVQKHKPSDSPAKKTFTRKPGNGHIPFTRKRESESVNGGEITVQQNNFSQLLQKSKSIKFVTSKSQASLNSSVISKSSASLSLANSKTQLISQEGEYSQFLPQESYSPQKQNQRQLFRRKTSSKIRTPVLTKKKAGQNQNTIAISSSVMSKNKKLDYAEQQTKLQSSEFSDANRSFYLPSSSYIITSNVNMLRNSKNSSKQSMRKSNSSNSIMKKEVLKPCRQCEYHKKQIKDLNDKLERIERIIRNKDEEIGNLNKKITDLERKNKQSEKKIKQIQKSDFPNKILMLQEELISIEEECTRMKENYTKSLQQLKYKNVENTTLKKYQAQCQGLERKCQLLVSQRNELRQYITKGKVSSTSSYIYYPSASRQSKTNHNTNNIYMKGQNHHHHSQNKTTYTQRNEDELDEQEQTLSTSSGFKKKKNYKLCDQSEDSQIISLSQQSNY